MAREASSRCRRTCWLNESSAIWSGNATTCPLAVIDRRTASSSTHKLANSLLEAFSAPNTARRSGAVAEGGNPSTSAATTAPCDKSAARARAAILVAAAAGSRSVTLTASDGARSGRKRAAPQPSSTEGSIAHKIACRAAAANVMCRAAASARRRLSVPRKSIVSRWRCLPVSTCAFPMVFILHLLRLPQRPEANLAGSRAK